MKGKVLFTKYKVVRQIGKGAFGEVYLVWDLRLRKYWAMKKVQKTKGMSYKEASVMKNLNHVDLPRIVDFIESEEFIYLVIDYIEGVNLQQLLDQGRDFDASYIVRWTLQLCDIFIYLHSQDPPIIYCDLKPSNLILTSDHRLKLIDFGIALSDTRIQYYGTKGYAAPEQYKSYEVVDERSDIYSLGKTMLTLGDIKKNRRLYQIFLKCTREDQRKRYQSMKQLKKRLYSYQKMIPRICICVIAMALCIFIVRTTQLFQKDKKVSNYNQYLQEGIKLEEQGEKKSKKVIECYEKAIEADSSKTQAYLCLLEYYMAMNRRKDGLNAMIQYVESDEYQAKKCDEVLYRVGRMYLQGDDQGESFQTNYNLAEKYFSMQRKRSKEGKLCYKLVRQLNVQGDVNWRSIHNMIQILKDTSKDFDTLYAVLKVYESNEEYLKSYQKSNQVKETFVKRMKEYESSNIHERIYQDIIIKKEEVVIYQGTKKWDQIIDAYVKILSKNKEKEEVWLFAAKYYEEMHQKEKVHKICKMLIKTYPKEMDAYVYYGLFLYQEGQMKEARNMYFKAKKMGGNKQYDYKLLEEKLGGIYEPS